MAMVVLAVVTLSAADSDREQAIRLARDTLARELSPSDAAAAAVSGVTDITWPDSSLGCPSAGIVYTPSVIAGYRVQLKVGAATYTVHVGAGRAIVCANRGIDAADPATVDGRAVGRSAEDAARGLKLAQQARSTLAARLRVPDEQVRIQSYRVTMWPDAGLGCEEAGVTRAPQPTKGFRIHLRAGERAFEFHSDLSRVVECDAATPR
jgi:hypothetical protein